MNLLTRFLNLFQSKSKESPAPLTTPIVKAVVRKPNGVHKIPRKKPKNTQALTHSTYSVSKAAPLTIKSATKPIEPVKQYYVEDEEPIRRERGITDTIIDVGIGMAIGSFLFSDDSSSSSSSSYDSGSSDFGGGGDSGGGGSSDSW